MEINRELPNSVLSKVSNQYTHFERALPHVEQKIGFLLHDLILAKNIKTILEIGTCLGYSTIFMGSAIKINGGRILTIEKDADLFWQAKQNIKEASLISYVDLICADACDVLPNLEKKYDLIFQDSQKNLYIEMLDETVGLLNDRGMLIADDTLLYLTNPYESIKRSICDYNDAVFAHSLLKSTIVPLSNGVTISVKKEA